MSLRSILQRSLTPVLTLLVAALGTITLLSVRQTQKKVEAFGCGIPCHSLQACQGSGSCDFCNVQNLCGC